MSLHLRQSKEFPTRAAPDIRRQFRQRAPWRAAVALEIALLRARLSASLIRGVERLLRVAASPTAATILEVRGWRSELPELGAIERELGARPASAIGGESARNPFDLSTRRPPGIAPRRRTGD